MAEVPELTKVLKKKPNPKLDDWVEGWKKQLKDMFLLPLTDDEMMKIREKSKETKTEITSASEIEEIIKRKRDLKKLYINIPKKSGFGFRLNYMPGCKEKQHKLCEEDKPREKKQLDYYDLLNMLLIKEGIKPVKKEEDRWPKIEDLSPRPGWGNS